MKALRTELGSIFLLLAALAVSLILTSCGKDDSIVDSTPTSTEETLLQLTESSDEIASFESNYNEEEAMEMSLSKISETIYPKKVGQRMHPVSKTFNATILGDSAYAVYTRTYEGQLIIVASTVNGGPADTVIYKSFTTQITRNLIFKKVYDDSCLNVKNSLDTSDYCWKIVAISLPEGGTGNTTIVFEKLSVNLPGGDTLVVTSPNDYYLSHYQGYRRPMPYLNQNQMTTVRIELLSSHNEQELVTLTCNGNSNGLHRSKRQFQLVSSEQVGGYYKRVYEGYWVTSNFPGHYHAVVNAMSSQSVTDDAAPVEISSWGIPYRIN
ncbi:MAG TPA: hypothetical protein VHP30_07245 [Ignavibacteriales bacterium]|nr:hypothetical protein [Ignavibacteriales bacterium]